MAQSSLDYPMPAGHSNGLTRPGFKIVPRFEFVNLGSEKHLKLKMDVQMSTARNPAAPFSFRYTHLGKEYTDHDLGFDPFTSISLGNASFTVLVQGPSLNTRVSYSVQVGVVDIGVVSKDALQQYYSAHVQSLDDIFYYGTENIVAAINQFERTKKDAADAAAKKISDDAANNKTLNDAARQKGAAGSTKSTTLKNTTATDDFWFDKKTASNEIGKLIPEQPNHKDLPNFIRTTDGGYYYKGADGKVRQVNAEQFQQLKDAAATATAKGKAPGSEQPERKITAAEIMANIQQTNAANAALEEAIYNKISGFTNMMQQNFYYAEAIRNGKQNLAELSSLSGSYNSIQQLEADFSQKYSSIRGQVNQIESNRNAALSNAVSNTFNGNATERSIGQGMQLIGNMINSGKAKKEEREAKERLRREREQQIASINAAKQKARFEMRNLLMKNFPNGGTPLSAHKIMAPEVYMFGYIIDHTSITNENANVSVSNVFPVMQYSDGSFPLRTVVSGKLQGMARGDVTIVGYYTDKSAAEQMRNSFISLARKSELVVNNVVLKTFAGVGKATVPGDFWETGQRSKPAGKDSSAKKAADFWNN